MVAGTVEGRWSGEILGGKVRAYDTATGEELWTLTLNAPPGPLTLVEDRILIAVERMLYELRA